MSETMTIPEFAAMCRERCEAEAQGYDDGRTCGSTSTSDDGEPVFHFCGRHWAAVL